MRWVCGSLLAVIVLACAGGCNSLISEAERIRRKAEASVSNQPPVAPAAPTATPISSMQIDLSWSAAYDDRTAADQLVYEICYSATAGGCANFNAMLTSAAGVTYASITGLSVATTYYFRVRTRDSAGLAGEATAEFSATTHNLGTVDTPTYAPVAGTYGSTQMVAISTTTSGATICYTTDGVDPVCVIDVCTVGMTYLGSVTIATDTTLKALACKAGYSVSSVLTGAYVIDTTPPTTPGGANATAAGATQLDLAYSAASDNTTSAPAIVYEICQSMAAGGCAAFTVTYTTAPGQTSFSVTGLSAMTTYYFRIRARDLFGNTGVPTAEFSGTTTDTPPTVIAAFPPDGYGSYPPGSTPRITFSKAMNPATLTAQNVAGTCSGSVQVSSDNFASCIAVDIVRMSAGDTVVGLRFSRLLQEGTLYKIRVTTAAQSSSGVSMASAFTYSTGFQTSFSGSAKVDYAFNTPALFSHGANGIVNVVQQLADGRYLVAGFFSMIGHVPRANIAILLTDGTVDPSFNPVVGPNNTVLDARVQSDGKILIAGAFTWYDGTARNRIARLNTDGTIDTTFNPGSGANSSVECLALQSDGKLVIGGDFSTYNGTARTRIARVNADGTLDTSFSPGSGTDSSITALLLQTDGKIVIGGNFTNYNGTGRSRIARIETNGALDTTFNPGTGANSSVHSIALQTDGKVIIGGSFTSFAGITANRIARILSTGALDSGFNVGTGANSDVFAVAVQADGKVLLAGGFTGVNGVGRNQIARVDSSGMLDPPFVPMSGAHGSPIHSLALQSDGKILLAGSFTRYFDTIRERIARINPDASVDTSFNPQRGTNSDIFRLRMQTDGKILLGGNFITYNDITRNNLARINDDGTLDSTFNPGTGASGPVYALALQSDGKILAGGLFSNYNGTARNNIARINSDGSLDASFNPGSGAGASVYDLAVQTDGKILLGGAFTSYNGVSRGRIARANSDGSIDATFTPGTGADGAVRAIAVQTDGKILIAGSFSSYNGTSLNRIARLNTDGTRDATFNPGTGANLEIFALALQSDGKILIGGNFTNYNGTAINRIARINADGTIDSTFNPGSGALSTVSAIALQADGKIVLGGSFTAYNGLSRNYLARIAADGSLDTTFDTATKLNAAVNALDIQADGKIVAGGSFSTFDATLQSRIVRIWP